MKKTILAVLFIIFLSSISANTLANEGYLPLLALLNKGGVQSGLMAGLDLKIIEGNEKVYLQTFPMTQISTQVSMRFAQQIACKEFELDCEKHDFLYTITASPGVIGGPSAGAAATVLTAAVLMNKTINKDIAMTGTINSGGLIGPVGGVEKKIEAAAQTGIKKVLIPFGTTLYDVGDNLTINLQEYAKELNITVQEVKTIDEAANIIAGIPLKYKTNVLKIDEGYMSKMKLISDKLCNRTESLINEVGEIKGISQFLNKSKKAMEMQDYYSAASYCFRSNILLRQKAFENLSSEEAKSVLTKLDFLTKKLRATAQEKKIRTLTDIETYMAVMERIEEAEQLLNSLQDITHGKTKTDTLALATERIYSASTWSEFFDLTYDTRIIADEEKIKESCQSKISEAEERINYVRFSFETFDTTALRESLEGAYDSMNKEDNIMCLYKASKVKAEADLVLALRGISEANFNQTMQLKLDAAKEAISKSFYSGTLPIISYSYYEYAQNLFNSGEAMAALFAEYALELASIDLYFKQDYGSTIKVIKAGTEEKETNAWGSIDKNKFLEKAFSAGALIIILLAFIIFYEYITRKREKKIEELMKKRK